MNVYKKEGFVDIGKLCHVSVDLVLIFFEALYLHGLTFNIDWIISDSLPS